MVWAVAAIHTTCSEKTADRFKNTLIVNTKEEKKKKKTTTFAQCENR